MNQRHTVRIQPDGVHISWHDGHDGYYPHWYLRAACKCADCLDSSSGNLMEFYDGISHDVRALDWMPLGQYAVEFLWTDGHSTGIYALETLRQICRCEVCLGRATARGDPGARA